MHPSDPRSSIRRSSNVSGSGSQQMPERDPSHIPSEANHSASQPVDSSAFADGSSDKLSSDVSNGSSLPAHRHTNSLLERNSTQTINSVLGSILGDDSHAAPEATAPEPTLADGFASLSLHSDPSRPQEFSASGLDSSSSANLDVSPFQTRPMLSSSAAPFVPSFAHDSWQSPGSASFETAYSSDPRVPSARASFHSVPSSPIGNGQFLSLGPLASRSMYRTSADPKVSSSGSVYPGLTSPPGGKSSLLGHDPEEPGHHRFRSAASVPGSSAASPLQQYPSGQPSFQPLVLSNEHASGDYPLLPKPVPVDMDPELHSEGAGHLAHASDLHALVDGDGHLHVPLQQLRAEAAMRDQQLREQHMRSQPQRDTDRPLYSASVPSSPPGNVGGWAGGSFNSLFAYRGQPQSSADLGDSMDPAHQPYRSSQTPLGSGPSLKSFASPARASCPVIPTVGPTRPPQLSGARRATDQFPEQRWNAVDPAQDREIPLASPQDRRLSQALGVSLSHPHSPLLAGPSGSAALGPSPSVSPAPGASPPHSPNPGGMGLPRHSSYSAAPSHVDRYRAAHSSLPASPSYLGGSVHARNAYGSYSQSHSPLEMGRDVRMSAPKARGREDRVRYTDPLYSDMYRAEPPQDTRGRSSMPAYGGQDPQQLDPRARGASVPYGQQGRWGAGEHEQAADPEDRRAFTAKLREMTDARSSHVFGRQSSGDPSGALQHSQHQLAHQIPEAFAEPDPDPAANQPQGLWADPLAVPNVSHRMLEQARGESQGNSRRHSSPPDSPSGSPLASPGANKSRPVLRHSYGEPSPANGRPQPISLFSLGSSTPADPSRQPAGPDHDHLGFTASPMNSQPSTPGAGPSLTVPAGALRRSTNQHSVTWAQQPADDRQAGQRPSLSATSPPSRSAPTLPRASSKPSSRAPSPRSAAHAEAAEDSGRLLVPASLPHDYEDEAQLEGRQRPAPHSQAQEEADADRHNDNTFADSEVDRNLDMTGGIAQPRVPSSSTPPAQQPSSTPPSEAADHHVSSRPATASGPPSVTDRSDSSDGRGTRERMPTPDNLLARAEEILAPLAASYDIHTTAGLPSSPAEAQALREEGCPLCLQSSASAAGSQQGFALLRCKRLGCVHVIHARCVLMEALVPPLQPVAPSQQTPARLLMRSHSTSFFRVLSTPPPALPALHMMRPGPRRGCRLELVVAAYLSEVCQARVTCMVDSVLDTDSARGPADSGHVMEQLVLMPPSLGAGSVSASSAVAHSAADCWTAFSLRRGRVLFRCQCPATGELWQYQAGYELPEAPLTTDAEPSPLQLLLVDAAVGATLLLLLVPVSLPAAESAGPRFGWGIHSVRLELAPVQGHTMPSPGTQAPMMTPTQNAYYPSGPASVPRSTLDPAGSNRHFFPQSPSTASSDRSLPRDAYPSRDRRDDRDRDRDRDMRGGRPNGLSVNPSAPVTAQGAAVSLAGFSPTSAALIMSDPLLQQHFRLSGSSGSPSGLSHSHSQLGFAATPSGSVPLRRSASVGATQPAPSPHGPPRSQSQADERDDPIMPHVVNRVAILSKSQCGSRFLQQRINEGDQRYLRIVYAEIFEHFGELMVDLFGNYLCQTVVERCTDEQRVRLLQSLRSRLGVISCDRQGTRAVQKLIACCTSDQQRVLALEGLCGVEYVARALSRQDNELPEAKAGPQTTGSLQLLSLIRDPNGSHVVHAVLDNFPPGHTRPVFDLAYLYCRELAVDQHGLCILKKCVSLAQPDALLVLAQRMLDVVMDFVNNQYGNYLVQHLVERDDPVLNARLHARLCGHYALLSRQKFSSNVVEKCLRLGSSEWQRAIISELTAEANIAALLQDSYGNYVMQNALSVAAPDQARTLINLIRPRLPSLRKNIRKKWERLLLDNPTGASGMVPQSGRARRERERERDEERRRARDPRMDRDDEDRNRVLMAAYNPAKARAALGREMSAPNGPMYREGPRAPSVQSEAAASNIFAVPYGVHLHEAHPMSSPSGMAPSPAQFARGYGPQNMQMLSPHYQQPAQYRPSAVSPAFSGGMYPPFDDGSQMRGPHVMVSPANAHQHVYGANYGRVSPSVPNGYPR